MNPSLFAGVLDRHCTAICQESRVPQLYVLSNLLVVLIQFQCLKEIPFFMYDLRKALDETYTKGRR